MYECPICGKSSNRRGDPFETKQQVSAHVDGSHDDDHQDIRGEDIRGEIAEVSESLTESGSEGASSDSSKTEDDSPSEPTEGAAQVSTSVRGEDSDDTGRTAETKSDAAADDAETFDMTPDEIDKMIETAAAEARAEQYDDDSVNADTDGGAVTYDPPTSPSRHRSKPSPSSSSPLESGGSLMFKLGSWALATVLIVAGILGLAARDRDDSGSVWDGV